jgi:hypothetical protein
VLPPRDEYLDRITPWLREQLRPRAAHHTHLVRPYAEWDVLHRARRAARTRGGLNIGTANNARQRISAAFELLSWLDNRNLTLTQLTQPDLDVWLDQPVNKHKPVAGFLAWAAKRHLASRLTVPTRRRGPAAAVLDEQQRWEQLRRCLNDDTVALPVRLVAVLNLLFGIATSRALSLTIDNVTTQDNAATHLTLGQHPIELPPRVADLVHQQLALASTPTNAPETPRWLFPGHLRVYPITPAHMSDLLTQHGIDTSEGRHAALVDLAADIPPPVLAALLNINIATAINWANRAQQDWSTYLAARVKEQKDNLRVPPQASRNRGTHTH